MLARSGKVSMATKKRSGEEINDRQILCGMGIKLRRLTAGISTLKATVEDGSGNLVEGVNVNFVLKSGSATLTSLTAVTDQNGLATTSVRGAMTGSVAVSAETSYGGAQTVDITLVAGPADASLSVLKNNRSSLKGDFTESAELHLVLHDLSGVNDG